MSLKAKIISRLKSKFSGVNLSKTRMDALADRLSKKLTEESEDADIDAALDEANEVYPFADIAKQDDRVRDLEAKAKAAVDPKDPKEDPKEDPKPGDDLASQIAKAVQAAVAPLMNEVNSLKSGKIGDTRKTRLESLLKDVNPKYRESVLKNFGRMSFETDEDFNAFADEVETDAKEFVQTEADNKLSGSVQPIMTTVNKAGITNETADYIATKKAAVEGKSSVAGKEVFS